MDAILILGNLGFNFRAQRPQKLAEAISEEYNIIYINPNPCKENNNLRIAQPNPELYPKLYTFDLPYFKFMEGNENLWSRPLTIEESMATYFTTIKELSRLNIRVILNIVMHPCYREVPSISNVPTISDCMDYIHGFTNVHPDIAAGEISLFKNSDCTVFTSSWLKERFEEFTNTSALIQNGYDRSTTEDKGLAIRDGLITTSSELLIATQYIKQSNCYNVVYIGAISEWFDKDNFIEVISKCSSYSINFIIIGRDDIGLEDQIAKSNLNSEKTIFLGELPHSTTIEIANMADMGIIPLNADLELIQATNPVKVYEYLSIGLSVLCEELPEVKKLAQINIICDKIKNWDTHILKAMERKRDYGLPQKKDVLDNYSDLLQNSSWYSRGQQYLDIIRNTLNSRPKIEFNVDAIIPTTASHGIVVKCIQSLCQYDINNIIVVINGQSDHKILDNIYAIEKSYPKIKFKFSFNDNMIGFSNAVNLGVSLSDSENILIVNDDMIFSPWSLRSMFEVLAKDRTSQCTYNVTTTNIDGDAYREHKYYTETGFYMKSWKRYDTFKSVCFNATRLGLNCCLVPKKIFDAVGGIPNVKGLGYGEDDIFYQKILECGFKKRYLPGAFVHHIGSLTFDMHSLNLKSNLISTNTN